MRLTAVKLAIALLFSLFCLSFQTAPAAEAAPPWEGAKDLIIITRIQPDGYLLFDPSTIRIVDGYITYQEYKESAAPKDRDIPYVSREIMIDLENRKARILWVKVFSPDGQELGGEAFPDSQWGDIEPGKQLDRALYKLVDQCQQNNLPVKLPSWYKANSVRYLGTTREGDNIYYLTTKEMSNKDAILTKVEWHFKKKPEGGSFYEVQSVAFKPAERKYMIFDRELLFTDGTKPAPNIDWKSIVPGSAMEKLFLIVLEFHQQHGWKPSE